MHRERKKIREVNRKKEGQGDEQRQTEPQRHSERVSERV